MFERVSRCACVLGVVYLGHNVKDMSAILVQMFTLSLWVSCGRAGSCMFM